jgi:hypothetical protein
MKCVKIIYENNKIMLQNEECSAILRVRKIEKQINGDFIIKTKTKLIATNDHNYISSFPRLNAI